MSLLPKSTKQFSSKQYWNDFFTKRGSKSFEWYGEYADLCVLLHKYMKSSDNIFVPGCGNSALSSDLYKSGFKKITNVDISEVVINNMNKKYKTICPEMQWIHGDIFKLPFEQDFFSCVLDKGTLDALITENSTEVIEKANTYFEELDRVLRVGGRFICVSLLQEHIVKALLDCFSQKGWMIRFCRCEDAEKSQQNDDSSFVFPVFVVVCTKFKKLPNFKPVIELSLQKDQLRRVTSENVQEHISVLQQFASVSHNLRSKLLPEEELSVDLMDQASGLLRFRVFVVDNAAKGNKRPYAVFIVPHGRETEWLFGSRAGRIQLSVTASANRLAVAHLARNQTYDNKLEGIQRELGDVALRLAPPRLPRSYKIEFLSVGSDLGSRVEVFRGHSDFSGDFLVEDVTTNEGGMTRLRRLVFLSNQALIQSEAKLVPPGSLQLNKRKKKASSLRKNDAPNKTELNSADWVVAEADLRCTHHVVMLTALEMIESASVLLVGLGGGALATYIHNHFIKSVVTVVDIDPSVVEVARRWFGFRDDDRLKCQVEDGVLAVEKAAEEGTRYDVIMFDVDSKDHSVGLSCPPKQFVARQFLEKVHTCLNKTGVFVLNLVCRDSNMKSEVLSDLKSVFALLSTVTIPEEVNNVIFCCKSKVDSAQLVKKGVASLKKHAKQSDVDLEQIINNLKML